jgi:lipoprotein-anchoring transpeptidase ErfK/SrfK
MAGGGSGPRPSGGRRRCLAAAVAAAALAAAATGAAAAEPGAYLVAAPTVARLQIHSAPGGAVVATVGPRTMFGSRRTLGVVAQRPGWVGVTTEALPNGRVGWVDVGMVSLAPAPRSVDVDLSQRRLRLYEGTRLLRSFAVAIGRADSPTPTGRFSITDKLAGSAYGSVYGCCILALSGHQPHPPAGWSRNRDWRLAIHGGDGIGAAVSAGCLHAAAADLRYLMRSLPLGTPVLVHG